MNSVFVCVMGELMLLLFIATHELRRPQRVLLCSRCWVLGANKRL